MSRPTQKKQEVLNRALGKTADAWELHRLKQAGTHVYNPNKMFMTKYYGGIDPYDDRQAEIEQKISFQPAIGIIKETARKKKEDKKKERSFSIFSFLPSHYRAIESTAKVLKIIGNVKHSKLNFKNK
jgi:hypothetical protein